jgi:hypothetical protein
MRQTTARGIATSLRLFNIVRPQLGTTNEKFSKLSGKKKESTHSLELFKVPRAAGEISFVQAFRELYK